MSGLQDIGDLVFLCLMGILTLRYDLGITSVMPWDVGCLTRKNTLRCRAFFAQCRAFFVDLFHFLLLLVIFFIGRKFCKLLFTAKRGKVCYFWLLFLLVVTFINYFLLLKRARV
jgi:hypothetical protein